MKKVGIITIVDLTNYGNRLQNYAVCKVFEKIGYKCETLYAIKGKKKTTKLKVVQLVKRIPFVLTVKLLIGKRKPAKYQRYLNFDKFSKKNIKLKIINTEEDLKKQCSHFDYFIMGSDQIWNPEYGYANDFFFAMFANPQQRICMSPSFGVQEISKEKDEISYRLRGIPYISVREESGRKIVKELTGKDAEVLIDPTMMLNEKEWRKICRKPNNVDLNKKYILSYFLGNRTEEQIKKINTIKEQYELDEYELLNLSKLELYSTGPCEFVELIRNADLVCTDSFHACVFSIIFKVPFVAFKRDGNGAGISSRIDTLLEKFKLEGRTEDNIREEVLFSNNYKECYEILGREQKKVYTYLEHAMNLKILHD